MKYRILSFLYVCFGWFRKEMIESMHDKMQGKGAWRPTAANQKEAFCNHDLDPDGTCVKCSKNFERVK